MVCNIDDTYEHLKLLVELFYDSDPQYVVKAMLMEMSIPSRYTGTRFLIAAVMRYDVNKMGETVTEVYAEVAAHFGGDISKDHIDSTIRDTARKGFSERCPGMWERYIPSVRAGVNRVPANFEIISELARVLDIWYGMRETYVKELREKEERYAIK